MSPGDKGVTWGPIPSRSLSALAFALRVVEFRNGARPPKIAFRLSFSGFVQPFAQMASSIFVSWLILNLYADYGPMKYTASNGVRYAHSDWALQGTHLIQLVLLSFAIILSSFFKFCLFLVIFKNRVLKFGKGSLAVLASVVLLFWAVAIGDRHFVNLEYYLFIPSSLHFSISLVIMSAILFLGVDSFRVIKVKPGIPGSI
jgi:hypothetical protein